MTEIEWSLINYKVNSDSQKMRAEYEKIKDDRIFDKLKFSQAIRGDVKNVGFFIFIITKGCDIRYYENFDNIKEWFNFKDKLLLTVHSAVDVLSPSKVALDNSSYSFIVGSYDNKKDAIKAANDISKGFFKSLISGEDNLNFCRESRKVLVERKNEPHFLGRISSNKEINTKPKTTSSSAVGLGVWENTRQSKLYYGQIF